MVLPQIIFPVGPGGSSPVTAATRSRLLALALAIHEHVGDNASACWHVARCQYIHGPTFFHLDVGGSLNTVNIVMVPAPETCLPTPADLARKLSTRTLILPVADATDAFYLSLFLFDNLTLRPALDPDQIIVPRSIRQGLGVFSCR
jgi:hypothetical protein